MKTGTSRSLLLSVVSSLRPQILIIPSQVLLHLLIVVTVSFFSAYSNAVLISGMFSNIVIFILSGFMVYGAVKGYQVFLLPWLALEVIAIIGVAIGAILGALYLPSVFGVSLLLVGILLMSKNNPHSS